MRQGRWLLAATIVVGGLGLGAVHTQVLVVCALLAVAANTLIWWDADDVQPRRAASLLVIVAAGLILWTGIQALPLPRGAVAAVAGANAEVWARSLSPLHEEGPSFITFSLDPVMTVGQLLRGLTYLLVFLGALRVAHTRDGSRFLERVLVVAVGTVAFAAFLHPVLGLEKVYGLYSPRDSHAFDPKHIGPLLNVNHLAAYANIGAVLGMANVFDREGAIPRPIAASLVLLLGATTVWTASRGGIGSMIVGFFAITVFTILARRRFSKPPIPAAVTLTGLVGVGLLLFFSFDATRSKFARNDLVKLDLVRNAFELVPRYPVFGIGRGAFESTFPEVRRGSEYWVNTHPENIFAQWTTEWGAPVAVVALCAIAFALRPRTVLARSRPPVGPWAVLVTAAFQNLFDFSSEIPGLMLALATCAAIVTGGRGNVERLARWARRPRLLAGTLGGLAAAQAVFVLVHLPHELSEEQTSARAAALDRTVSRDQFRAAARAAMSRHPSEAYFPFVGEVRAVVARDESPVPWAARVFERSPVYGRAHLVLARSLFQRSPSQARLEYRLACEQDSQLCTMQEALPLVTSFDDAMELVPEGPRSAVVLSELSGALARRLPSTVVRLDRMIAEVDSQSSGPLQRRAEAALADVRDDAAWCDRTQRHACLDDGLNAAEQLRTKFSERCEGHALHAELRIALGEQDRAFDELGRAVTQVQDRSACARRLVALAVAAGNRARVDAAIERLLALGCEAPAECVENFVFAGHVELSRQNSRRGVTLLRKAWERAPERDELLVEVATEAARSGFHGEALDAYGKLTERHPGDTRWTDGVAREREAVARGLYERR